MVMRTLAVAAVALVSSVAAAADFSLILSQPRAAVGESVLLRVKTTDGSVQAVPTIQVPAGVEIEFSGQEQRMESTLQGITRTSVHQYVLTGLAEGRYEIGPAIGDLGGKRVESQSVVFEVTKRSVDPDAPFLVDAFLNPTELWEGQVAVYSATLSAREQLFGVTLAPPNLTNFRSATSGNGLQYEDRQPERSTWHWLIPVVPMVSEEVSLSPARVTVRIPTGEQGIFGSRTRAKQLVSDVITANVKPLPPSPSDFSGLIGSYNFKAQLSTRNATVGDSVVLVVTGVGDGEIDGLKLPKLNVDGVREYDEGQSIAAEVQQDTGTYRSRGTFKRSLVPTKPGTYKLPDLELIVFDTKQGEYRPVKVTLGTLNVTGTEELGDLTSFAGEPIEPPPEARPTIRPAFAQGWTRSWPMGAGALVAWLVVGLPGIGVALGVVREWAQRQLESRRVQQEAAPVRGSDLLRDLPQDRTERLTALDGALRHGLAETLGEAPATVRQSAGLNALPVEIRQELKSVFEDLDRVRFAGAPLDEGLESRVRALVNQLESA